MLECVLGLRVACRVGVQPIYETLGFYFKKRKHVSHMLMGHAHAHAMCLSTLSPHVIHNHMHVHVHVHVHVTLR